MTAQILPVLLLVDQFYESYFRLVKLVNDAAPDSGRFISEKAKMNSYDCVRIAL
jgi:hypothetical protein